MSAIDLYQAPNSSMPTMFRHYKAISSNLIDKSKQRQVSFITQRPTVASPTASLPSPLSANLRTTVTMNKDAAIDPHDIDVIFQQKQSLRAKIRKQLKLMDPAARSEEDDAIQSHVVDAPWFKASKRLCAYISCASLREVETSRIVSEVLSKKDDAESRKKLYVPRVEDRNSNMRMLRICSVNDLLVNSMNILEPPLVYSDGNQREDAMDAGEPADLVILPGLGFDRSGRRLGRGGGYYDVFLKKYRNLMMERNWKRPLLVGLAYSIQIMEEGVIPVTPPHDVPVDALVSAAGFIPINSTALEGHMTD